LQKWGEVELCAAIVSVQPICVSPAGGVVIKDHMNLFVGRQFDEYRVQKTPEVFPLFLLGSLSENRPLAISSAANRFSVPLHL